MNKKIFNESYARLLGLVLTILLVLLALIGCSGANDKATAESVGSTSKSSATAKADSNNNGYGLETGQFQDKASTTSTSNSNINPNNNTNAQTGHKIIQTGQVGLETVKFDETVSGIQSYINSIGGYIQSSSVQGKGVNINNTSSKRYGTFVLRIPQNKYSEFFTSVKGYGSITYQESKGEDVTEQYFDTDARVKSLITQEERILDILKKTDKLSDIIELERRLSEIRYQIDSLTGTLKKWDNLVSFSTITLQIQEVEEVTKVAPEKSNGLFKRISFGFTNSIKQLGIFLQGTLVFIFTILPFLAVLIIIGLIILTIIKRHNKIRIDRNNNSASSSSNNLDNDNNLENNSSETSNSENNN